MSAETISLSGTLIIDNDEGIQYGDSFTIATALEITLGVVDIQTNFLEDYPLELVVTVDGLQARTVNKIASHTNLGTKMNVHNSAYSLFFFLLYIIL